MRSRLGWDDYFMIQALWAPMRSPDESTKHGSFIVNKDNVPIAQGYNGFPKGCKDDIMPQSRPDKYEVIIHSELNAIFNANASTSGTTLYVSGFPCTRCWCAIIQADIKRVVYGPIKSKSCNSAHIKDGLDNKLVSLLLQDKDIQVVKWIPQQCGLIIQGLTDIIENTQLALLKEE